MRDLDLKKKETYWITKFSSNDVDSLASNRFKNLKKKTKTLRVEFNNDSNLYKISNGKKETALLIQHVIFTVLISKYFSINNFYFACSFSKNEQIVFPLVNLDFGWTMRSVLSACQKEIVESLRYKNFDSKAVDEKLKSIHQIDFKELIAFALIPKEHELPNFERFVTTFHYEEKNDHFEFTIQYIDEEPIALFLENFEYRFKAVFESLLKGTERSVSDIDLLSEEEKTEQLISFNDTKRDYPNEKSVIDLFEEQVNKNPDNIAVYFEGKTLTYKKLNETANQIAHFIVNQYAPKANDRIALIMERSEAMLTMIIAILKTGAAYVPIDPEYPNERQKFMVKDSEAIAIITDQDVILEFASKSVRLKELDSANKPAENLRNKIPADDLIYIMYTSGSTGKPKGVMTSHQNVVRLVKNTNYISVNETDRFLQLSNYAFDGSTFDIFAPLLNGASLYLLHKDTAVNSSKLSKFIIDNQINVSFMTTALFNGLVELKPEIISQFDKLFFGGEECSIESIRKALEYRKYEDSIVHVYGPTESTTFASFYPIQSITNNAYTVAIGKAISNTKIYLLDSHQNLQLKGAISEIYIAGDGLAKGYLNRSDLSEKNFIANPFDSGKLYKTGDLGRYDNNGNIIFSGRSDNQVKIRGFRIELAEIENLLLSNNAVEKAAVVVIGKKDKSLAAFIKLNNISINDVKVLLKNDLPRYMVPDFLYKVDDVPLNQNGKTDKKKLIELYHKDHIHTKYISPNTETEKILVKIWEDVLEKEKVGIRDNFFELGGHSIKAMKAISKINQELKIELNPKLIFNSITIEEIAQELDKILAIRKIESQEELNDGEKIIL